MLVLALRAISAKEVIASSTASVVGTELVKTTGFTSKVMHRLAFASKVVAQVACTFRYSAGRFRWIDLMNGLSLICESDLGRVFRFVLDKID